VQSIDTNVVVRLVVQDDEAQARRAEDVFRKALGADGVRMTSLVLAETVWVLRSGYRFERSKIVEVLQWLLAIEGLTVESDSEV
jgi:predicted nucleic-acid-binding protein